jgi:uncharacterized glyoxalase superfamily protein PhnB
MPSVFPTLRYRDSGRAVTWLEEAFGFQPVMVHEGENGTIAHAELVYGDGMVMLGTVSDDGFGSHTGQASLYVVVEDPDAHHAQAKAAGAEIVRELEDQDYGSRDYSARDFEGNLWSFGTYRPSLTAT